MNTHKIRKVVSGVFALLLITSAFATVGGMSVSATSAPAPPVDIVEEKIDASSVVIAIDFSSWDSFIQSINDYFTEIYNNAEDFVLYVKDVVMENYETIDSFIKDLINSIQSTSSSDLF